MNGKDSQEAVAPTLAGATHAECGEDRQTERPVCLAKAHDSMIRILENPENHVDGLLGPTDGRGLFAGLADHFKQAA